eukprot:CAMPEP_0201714880 /NCGR_PEP_ID=MMETSP0593-20130828/1163_1 /ASSEMBLY_ACC=CAM_ASM_000672 /TAXON_ID=267983 /ORGANISM="Skeletonema japonicum, Strain CCMP2506" /LENGTH=224 /DNA_ID=CAMNT_0048204193 /DNA_START=8 /DNA_END=682 /DNA_ORIENTATION=+
MMQSTHSSSSGGIQQNAAASNPDQKVLTDLSTLTDQINLCQSMLAQAGSSIDGDEALLQVIGFLEACVPRMVELIEAAAQGALKPETFEECLVVNDKLANMLSDVDKDPKDRQPIVPAAAAAAATAVGDSEVDHVEEDMDKMAIGGSASPLPVATGGKTTGLDDVAEDPFSGGVDLLSPTPLSSDPFSTTSTTSAAVAPTTNDDDDDFDAFFRDRTSAGGGKQD